MASLRETKMEKPGSPDLTGNSSPRQQSYFGWQVERRFEEPHEFSPEQTPDVFGRTPATPRQILENSSVGKQITPTSAEQLSPWAHLPKAAFYIEEDTIVIFDPLLEEPNRRAREDMAISGNNEHQQFTSAKRQSAANRELINIRKREGKNKSRGGLRPTQGGRR